MDQFYIHLSSVDSKNLYPDNSPSAFTVQLPERINLYRTLMCALAEIEYSCTTADPLSSLLVITDLCDSTIVGTTKIPILRRLKHSRGTYTKVYPTLQYYPIKTYTFDTIHLHINTYAGDRASFHQGTLKATLHFHRTQ